MLWFVLHFVDEILNSRCVYFQPSSIPAPNGRALCFSSWYLGSCALNQFHQHRAAIGTLLIFLRSLIHIFPVANATAVVTDAHKCFHTRQKNSVTTSPQANYTDRATAASQRSWCQLLRIEGVAWSAQRIPMAVFSVL
jgi:hypothetical protein